MATLPTWTDIGQGFLNGSKFLEDLGEWDDAQLMEYGTHFLSHLQDVHRLCAATGNLDETAASAHELAVLIWDEVERSGLAGSEDPKPVRGLLMRLSSNYLHAYRRVGAALISRALTAQPQTVSDNEQRLLSALESPVNLEFRGNPLMGVVERLQLVYRIPILVDEQALSDAGISSQEEVCLVISGVTLRSALNILLGNVAGVPLDWYIADEVMWITTHVQAEFVRAKRRLKESDPDAYYQWLYERDEAIRAGGTAGKLPAESSDTPPDSAAEPSADVKTDHLQLQVDLDHCEIRRKGQFAVASFERDSAEWHTVLVAWRAAPGGATVEQWLNGYPGEPRARAAVKRNVNDKLVCLGVRLAPKIPPKLVERDDMTR